MHYSQKLGIRAVEMGNYFLKPTKKDARLIGDKIDGKEPLREYSSQEQENT
ncbi:MAG: hypothetical protein JRN68_06950 [Nitrososphaerota archaeon]|nr:hypothetical protein [Nitrososphaerota archaeon]